MHMNIGQRILAGFALIMLMTIGLGLYQIFNIGQMRDLLQRVVDSDFNTIRILRQIDDSQGDMKLSLERVWVLYLLQRAKQSDQDWVTAQNQWELARLRMISSIDELQSAVAEDMKEATSRRRIDHYESIVENARNSRRNIEGITATARNIFGSLKSENLQDARSHLAVLNGLRQALAANTAESLKLAAELPRRSKENLNELYESTTSSAAIAMLLVVLVGLLATWQLHRSIKLPLGGFMSFVERVGRGDLSRKTETTARDELGQLGHTLNGMVDNLAEMARQSRTAAAQLNSATAQMQASAKQQAASTSEQSAAIQQITSTLNEITQSGIQISERATAVAATAESTMSAGRSGSEAISVTSRAMVEIGEQAEAVAGNIVALTEKTHSIGEIIASVNDIAERSNLLALNAAIEAAAAGEHGQSFSVVADEMKNLADQAKAATLQIGGLLSEIQKGISTSVMQTEEAVKRAEAGRLQMEKTEMTIHSLVESVEDSVATFQQIVAGTSQQQIGIEQVSQSIRNIQVASEQMAVGIRDLEQSAGNLSALSNQLEKSVDRYVV